MPSVFTQRLVKGYVGFIGHCILLRCINNSLIEFIKWIFQLPQEGRDLLYFRIEPDT